MAAVIPKLYLDVGWPYKKRPSNRYRSPSGTITIAGEGHPVPCHADREILLYIAYIAHTAGSVGVRARGSLRELAVWLGAERRRRRLRARLHRVMSCHITWKKSEGDIRIIRIGDLEWFVGGSFQVTVDPDFHESCLSGVPYSIERASEFRSQPALLDLYLALVYFVHQVREYAEFTHEFYPYNMLPLADSDSRARQALAERLERLRDACPGAFFTLAPTGIGIFVDIGRPKRITRAGVSRQEWEERERYGRMIRKQDPEYRRRLGTLIQSMTELEKRLQGRDVWSLVFQVLDQAEARTEQAFERVEQLIERMSRGDTREPGDE